MRNFKQLPLATAVLSALIAAPAFAEGETNAPTQELETINVRADRQGAKVKTNVVTSRIKDERTETDLRGLFRNEPAIAMGGGNGTSQFMYIRGMGQNSVDVKVDNAYSDGQIHYHQGRHMLDPALVKIVSVQKGAGSASAGIGQTNGAVIAKTLDAADLLKNSSNPNFGARINAGISSNHEHNYGVALSGKTDMFDILVSGNRVKSTDYEAGKGYKNAVDGSNRVPFSGLDKRSYLIKFGLNLNKHRFVLSHMNELHHGDRTVREEFAAIKGGSGGTSLAGQAPVERKMTVDKTDLTWTAKDLGFVQAAEANVYHLVHGRWSADDSGNGYGGGANNKKGESTKTKVETIGANVNFDSRITENVLLKYGVNYRNQESKPNAFFKPGLVNQEKRDVGVYVEGITDIANKVTLTTGLRYDHFSFKGMDGKKVSDGAINPSIGVVYEPIPNLSFSASHNYATRSPRMQDALLSHGTRGVVAIQKGTKAERARNTEIGFNFNNGTWGVEGSYFWQDIKDALGREDGRDQHAACATGTKCVTHILNAGRIKNKGYELSGSYHYKGFTARLGVAHSKPRFHSQTKWKNGRGGREEYALLNGNPDSAAPIGRTWTASVAYRFDKPNLEIALHHRLVERVKKEDNYFIQGGTLARATSGKKGYGLTDITANWKPLGNDRMNVNFAVNNVTNKKYYDHAQRSGGSTAQAALYGAGREFRVGVNYTF